MISNNTILTYAMLVTGLLAMARSSPAQQTTGAPGSPAPRRRSMASIFAAASGVRRRDQHERQGFQTVLASPGRASQGRTEHTAHPHRRRGLWRHRALSAVSFRRRRWTASQRRVCATRSSTPRALCSPTRAALITGRNHHSVGFGVITEQSTGYPGYDSVIGTENANHRRDPETERILRLRGSARITIRQVINTACRGPSTNGRAEWASIISMDSWAARPTSGGHGSSRITHRSFRGSESPVTT